MFIHLLRYAIIGLDDCHENLCVSTSRKKLRRYARKHYKRNMQWNGDHFDDGIRTYSISKLECLDDIPQESD